MSLIQNGIYIPETGQIVLSTHRHDFVAAILPDGSRFCVDGGLDYVRRAAMDLRDPRVVDVSLHKEDPFEKICDFLAWGTHGPEGKDPLKYKFMKDLEPDHLRNILRDCRGISPLRARVIKYWLEQKDAEHGGVSGN